ncbi:MAG: MBL fold metallo-hydrolase [Terriglobia bacterium]|nr:MAG: MBL fold metallo-hydrolase [Terriglobia bacterium]
MKQIAVRYLRLLTPALAFVAIGAIAYAQGQPDFSKVEIKTTKITNNFYTLEGQGGTIGILTGPDGIFMVDTQFAPLSEKIMAAIRKVSNGPIKFIVNTHVHGDHTGGNENFAKMGATILARENLRNRLAHPAPNANGTPGTPAPPAALPLMTYNGLVTFHMDGEDVQLIPIPAAHTDGDTMVRFVNADVIMTGDFYRSIQYPNIDRVNGGSLNGMIDGLGQIIARSGPNTKIIPGHGPTVDRTAVMAHRDMILGVRDRVAKLIEQGKSQDEVLAAKPTADYDAKVQNSGETTQRFVTQLYAELKPAR